MKIDNIFDGTIQTLQRNLDVRARKHEVITSNIANADTPNYKSVELMVENELAKNDSSLNQDILMRTNPKHLPVTQISPNSIRTSKLYLSKEVTLRGDGNTVNIEKEMAEMAENNLMYRVSADILSRKFEGLTKAIQGGRR